MEKVLEQYHQIVTVTYNEIIIISLQHLEMKLFKYSKTCILIDNENIHLKNKFLPRYFY